MKLTPSTVDVLLSTLDQLSPTTGKPIGRLESLVNTKVTQYQNPRAADGTVTHVRVEKRDGFRTITDVTKDIDGSVLSPISGTPQVLYGGSGALQQVTNNRLYLNNNQGWIRAGDASYGPSIVFPQSVRSASIYVADSQAEAPDVAIFDDITCSVWREVALEGGSDDDTLVPPVRSSIDGVRVMFRDQTSGTVIRPAFTLDPVGGGTTDYRKCRCVMFGSLFYVLQDYLISSGEVNIVVTAFQADGILLGSTTIAGVAHNESWDVAVIPTDGVVVAMPNNGSGVKFTQLVWGGFSFTITTNTDTSITNTGNACYWLRDDSNTAHKGILATRTSSGTTSTVLEWRIVSLAQTHAYLQATSYTNTAQWLSGVTGYEVQDGTGDLVVAMTLMDINGFPEFTMYGPPGGPFDPGSSTTNNAASDQYPDQLNNVTRTAHVLFGGAATLIKDRLTLSLVSRAFTIGTDYVAWCYYPARKWGPLPESAVVAATHEPYRPADPSNFQPTWYLIPLASTQPIAGRLEQGLAAADYQVLTPGSTAASPAVAGIPGARNRCLSSVVYSTTGAPIVPMCYRAEQNIPSAQLLTQGFTFNNTPNNAFFTGSSTTLVYMSANTVGVKLFTLGPDCGQPFTINGTTFFPGLMSQVVERGDVLITEHGVIAPECPWITTDADVWAGVAGRFFYRSVGEYVSTSGKTYRSLPSAAFAFTEGNGGQNVNDCNNHFLAPTNKNKVKVSYYRTAKTTIATLGTATTTSPPEIDASATTQGFTSTFYKITNDLTPFYNDPATSTGIFKDTVDAVTMAVGELIYTDQGLLPRFPCPSFRGGCTWKNRAWVIGYDNALWFSAEIQEGEGEWFNPGFRIAIPVNEEVTAIAPMDNFLLVFCEKSIWYIPDGAALPDATGSNGSVPAAIRLPFEMGNTGGFTSVIRQGCAYSSSNGGVWMITRALDNVWLGQQAQDVLDGTISGMVVAGNNIVVAINGDYTVVYDTNLGAWAQWLMPSAATKIAADGGQAAFCDNGLAWLQTPGTYLDVDTVNIATNYVVMSGVISPVHIAGVRSWKRTWALQAEGTVFEACKLVVGLSYTDSGTIDFIYPDVDLVPGELEEEFRPSKQLASSIGMTFSDLPAAVIGTGRGFALEVVSFYVGLEKGLNKISPAKRA